MMNDQARSWIGFNLVKGIGPVRLTKLLEYFGDVGTAWTAEPSELRAAGLRSDLIDKVMGVRRGPELDRILEKLRASRVKLLTWDDPGYPSSLQDIPRSPPVLYLRGSLGEEDHRAAAVVGTRRCTAYGRQAAEETARMLARRGITVVSGLARGIDGIAHQAALDAGGRTLAVLGSGVDRIYPPEHRSLAEAIEGQGAVISDYPLGTAPDGSNFPPRNRIVSGLSQVVIVIEAGRRSGALITANYAAEQGRDLFALPGKIYAPQSKGTNYLLKQGAFPLTGPEDVLEWFDLTAAPEAEPAVRTLPSTPVEAKLFEVLGPEALHVDEICARTGLPISQVTSALTMMELKGLVRKTASMRYRAETG